MSRAKRSGTERGLWRGFRRPVRHDRAFWVASILAIAAVAAEVAVAGAVGDVNGPALALMGALVVVVVFSVVGAIAGMIRGFSEGFGHAPSGTSAPPGSDEPAEPAATAGPAATPSPGRGDPPRSRPGGLPTSVAGLSESARTLAGNVRKPTSADVDKGARTLGRAIGAARRAARSDPDA